MVFWGRNMSEIDMWMKNDCIYNVLSSQNVVLGRHTHGGQVVLFTTESVYAQCITCSKGWLLCSVFRKTLNPCKKLILEKLLKVTAVVFSSQRWCIVFENPCVLLNTARILMNWNKNKRFACVRLSFEHPFHCQKLNRFAIHIVCVVDSDKFSAQYSLLMGYGDVKFQHSQVYNLLRNSEMSEEWKCKIFWLQITLFMT